MKKYRYTAFGFGIESELQCPYLLPSNKEPDIYIRLGKISESVTFLQGSNEGWQLMPHDRFLYQIEGIAKYLITRGKEIIVDPVENASHEKVQIFLLGSALGALLHQTDRLGLHASAINTKKGSILFMGPSGIGKSSIISSFYQKGYNVLTDDICALSFKHPGQVVAHSGYPRMKLKEDVVKLLSRSTKKLSVFSELTGKFILQMKNEHKENSYPVHRIYLLSIHDSLIIQFEELIRANKFKAITENTFRFHFLKDMNLQEDHFKKIGSIVNQVVIKQVKRPGKPLDLKTLTEQLEEDFN